MATSNLSSRPIAVSGGLGQWIRQHPLLSFFVMAYAISWVLSIPVLLSEWNLLPAAAFLPFFIIKSFGPAVAAYITIRVTEGKQGWLNLGKSIRQWRVGWQWYALILLGLPAFLLLGILILPGAAASFQGLPPYFLVAYLINFIAIFFGGGALGEEPGWRGFALPRLQARFGAFRATLLLGVIWVFWHLPDFLTRAQGGGPEAGLSPFYTRLPIFFLMVVAMAFVFTWVFNHTRGSLFIAILLHASINAFGYVVSPSVFSAPIVTSTDLPIALIFAALAAVILILTRGRLGYQPDANPRG